ncbi:MAG: peptidylprolyl isomerase [Gammaproteobacteria bacterium]|jgi:peptidyl-prolyl cis-trans isomerase B (cyclophilin B)
MNSFIKSLLFSLPLVLALSTNAAAQQLVAVIETEKGTLEIELNQRAAPTTVANFVNLAMRGFYDGLTFHRVERNFMIQGGDPLGTGTGGPGYRFSGETILHHSRPGVLSMANSGPGTDGSQFFITHVATPHLDGLHSVFGRVTSGLETVYEIRRGDVINSITIVGDPAPVLERRRARIEEWNTVLNENFPDLKPSPLLSQ